MPPLDGSAADAPPHVENEIKHFISPKGRSQIIASLKRAAEITQREGLLGPARIGMQMLRHEELYHNLLVDAIEDAPQAGNTGLKLWDVFGAILRISVGFGMIGNICLKRIGAITGEVARREEYENGFAPERPPQLDDHLLESAQARGMCQHAWGENPDKRLAGVSTVRRSAFVIEFDEIVEGKTLRVSATICVDHALGFVPKTEEDLKKLLEAKTDDDLRRLAHCLVSEHREIEVEFKGAKEAVTGNSVGEAELTEAQQRHLTEVARTHVISLLTQHRPAKGLKTTSLFSRGLNRHSKAEAIILGLVKKIKAGTMRLTDLLKQDVADKVLREFEAEHKTRTTSAKKAIL